MLNNNKAAVYMEMGDSDAAEAQCHAAVEACQVNTCLTLTHDLDAAEAQCQAAVEACQVNTCLTLTHDLGAAEAQCQAAVEACQVNTCLTLTHDLGAAEAQCQAAVPRRSAKPQCQALPALRRSARVAARTTFQRTALRPLLRLATYLS